MSVETDPIPPVPEHTPPLKDDENTRGAGKFFNQAWTRWFVSVRNKINVIDDSLINLINVTGVGFLAKNGASWATRTFLTGPGIVWTNGDGALANPQAYFYAETAPIAFLPGATYTSLQQYLNVMHSPGLITGGLFTDLGGGNLNVSEGTIAIRILDDDVSQLLMADFPPDVLAIPNDSIVRFIGVEYNAGSPQIILKPVNVWDMDTEFPLGTCANLGGTLFPFYNPFKVGDPTTNIIQRFDAEAPLIRSAAGGLLLGDLPVRTATLTAGTVWARLNDYSITAKDSGTQTLTAVRPNPALIPPLLFTPGLTQWPNTQYLNGTTLTVMTNNRWANLWFFVNVGSNEWGFAYGTDQYNNSSQAAQEGVPAYLPTVFLGNNILVGRLIFEKSNDVPIVESAFNTVFSTQASSDHNQLSNLQGGQLNEYFHLTNTQHSLIDTTVLSVVAGTNVAVDNTDPRNPIVSAAGGGGGGGTVLSVDISSSSLGVITGGGPITVSGTFTVDLNANLQDWSGTTVASMATLAQLTAGLAPKAPLDSPAFTGNPTAPTPPTGDNDTSLATTAFVKAQNYVLKTGDTMTGTLNGPEFNSTGVMRAQSTFVSTDVNVVLASGGVGGGVFLRPNGIGSGVGQAVIGSDGRLTVNGPLDVLEASTMGGSLQVNNGIIRSQGFGGDISSGLLYLGTTAVDSYIWRPGGTGQFVFKYGDTPAENAILSTPGGIWTSGNFSPTNYVLKTGDTMSGILAVERNGGTCVRARHTITTNPAAFCDLGQNPTSAPGDEGGFLIARGNGDLSFGTNNTIRGRVLAAGGLNWDYTISTTGNLSAGGAVESGTGGGSVFGGAGGVFLRPNGIGTQAGQALVLPNGDFNCRDVFAVRPSSPLTGVIFFGDQTGGSRYLFYDGTRYEMPGGRLDVGGVVAGSVIECPTMFRATGPNVVLAAGVVGGAVILRPNGDGNALNQAVLDTDGVMTAVNFVPTSDARLKTSITYNHARDRLPSLLKFASWLWKTTNEAGIGLIAQDVQLVAPEYVHAAPDGTLGIDKASLALECVIGLAARVTELETQLKLLTKGNSDDL